MTGTAAFLVLWSCALAVLHALIPDHWLPFVLLSRAQGWSDRKTAGLAGFAGLLHAFVSTAVGALLIVLGSDSARGLAERAGRSLEFLAGLLLVGFGLAYGTLAHLREARAHRSGSKAGVGSEPFHAHGHLLERWFRTVVSGGALVVVIGISPCALMVPVLFAASTDGVLAVVAAATGFAVCTIGTMAGVTLFAARGMRRFDLPFFTHYGDLISGLLIAALGLIVMLGDR